MVHLSFFYLSDDVPIVLPIPVENHDSSISDVVTPRKRQEYSITRIYERPQEGIPAKGLIIDAVIFDEKKANKDKLRWKSLFPNALERQLNQRSSEESSDICTARGICVDYTYEHDIYDQVFNSSLEDPKSAVMRHLQALIADWTMEEIHKRNLPLDIIGEVPIPRIVDISKQYEDRPTVRYYVSMIAHTPQIPIVRHILTLVFKKLQKECCAKASEQPDWSNIIVISM